MMRRSLSMLFLLVMLPFTSNAEAAKNGLFAVPFIQAQGGVLYLLDSFQSFNRPTINGIPANVSTTNSGLGDLSGSFAAGLEYPDHFRLYLSSDWVGKVWMPLANAQWELFQVGTLGPYVHFGLGVDFEGDSWGPAAQLGLGADLEMTADLDFFLATDFYVVNNYHASPRSAMDHTQDFVRWELVAPVEAGLKLRL